MTKKDPMDMTHPEFFGEVIAVLEHFHESRVLIAERAKNMKAGNAAKFQDEADHAEKVLNAFKAMAEVFAAGGPPEDDTTLRQLLEQEKLIQELEAGDG